MTCHDIAKLWVDVIGDSSVNNEAIVAGIVARLASAPEEEAVLWQLVWDERRRQTSQWVKENRVADVTEAEYERKERLVKTPSYKEVPCPHPPEAVEPLNVRAERDLLSPMERSVFAYLSVADISTERIATLLGVSKKTIEVHRDHIRKKLGVHTAQGLTVLATEARMRAELAQSPAIPG